MKIRELAQHWEENATGRLTKTGIAAENFPFCTIEPNSGIVAMPDPRLQELAAIERKAARHCGNAPALRGQKWGR